MRSGFVAARDERGLNFCDAGEGGDDAFFAGNAGRVGVGADDDEVVSHESGAPESELILDEQNFIRGGVDHQDVHIAVFAQFERSSGADRDDMRFAFGALAVKMREDEVQQSGVFGGGGGGQAQRRSFRARGRNSQAQKQNQGEDFHRPRILQQAGGRAFYRLCAAARQNKFGAAPPPPLNFAFPPAARKK